jgi:hypothetical protein
VNGDVEKATESLGKALERLDPSRQAEAVAKAKGLLDRTTGGSGGY